MERWKNVRADFSIRTSEAQTSKWKSGKYSRSARQKRKRDNVVDIRQPEIVDFFTVLNEIDLLVAKNTQLMEALKACPAENMMNELNSSISSTTFLKDMLKVEEMNQKKHKNGRRYSSNIKKIAMYSFIVGGRAFYENLQKNLPLPTADAIVKYMADASPPPIEGALRIQELVKFIDKTNSENNVWIAEDATRISERLEYDPKTNTIMGFVLPIGGNGLPIPLSFPAESALHIFDIFQHQKPSSYANVIMVQTLGTNPHKFCLAIYGTDNKFTANDVTSRWKYIVDELHKHGVRVIGKFLYHKGF